MSAARSASTLKSLGYLISIISVLLIGASAWSGIEGSPRLRLCLAAGMIASVLGMALRWYSYLLEQRQKR